MVNIVVSVELRAWSVEEQVRSGTEDAVHGEEGEGRGGEREGERDGASIKGRSGEREKCEMSVSDFPFVTVPRDLHLIYLLLHDALLY